MKLEQIPHYSLKKLFYEHRYRYALGFVLLAAYQVAQYLFDMRLLRAIDIATQEHDSIVARLGLELMAIAAVALVVRIFSRTVVFHAGRMTEYDLREVLLAQIHRLGAAALTRFSSGEILSRMTNDVTQVRLLLGFGSLNAMNTLMGLASALAVMFRISLKLTLATMLVLPLLIIVTRFISQAMFRYTQLNQERLGKLSQQVQTDLSVFRVIRAYGLEHNRATHFEDTNRDYLDASLKLARSRGAIGPVMQTLGALSVVVVLWYGGTLLAQHSVSTGGLLAFFRASLRLTWPLTSLGFVIAILQRGRASFQRILHILELTPEVQDGASSAVPSTYDLRADNLSFSYGERKVLDQVSFNLKPGRSLAVVGRTGSGKSTLASLLLRLLPTPKASVYLDNNDVCDLPLETVRHAIAYAPQTPFLFSSSVSDNLRLVLRNPEESIERIEQVLDQAHVLSEIKDLPQGIDTVVGERGVQLSGGQKQRLALARALLYDSPVMVLDDPLSAVDSETERYILDVIRNLKGQRSLLLITHRIAAAAQCDEVIVLDRGQVVERGTPQSLSSASGIYRAMLEEQRREEALAALA